MSKAFFLGAEFQGIDDNGNPLAGGLVYFYEAATTTDKDVFTDSTLNTKHFQPVVLDANGRAAIWMTGNYKVVLRDSTGVLIYDEDNVNTETSSLTNTILNNSGSAPANGSFELDDIISGTPDYWTLTPNTNGSVAIDTANKAHGLQSLKFTSTDANGAGEALSDAFNVLAGGSIGLKFSYFSSSATTLNIVTIIYDDGTGAWGSAQIPHTFAAGNPTSWTEYIYTLTVPATAVQAKVWLQSVVSGGTTMVGTTTFDNVVVAASSATTNAFRGALAFSSVDIAKAPNSLGYLALDSNVYSTDSIHDLSDNTKLTVPAGVTRVRISYQVVYAAGSTGIRSATIKKNITAEIPGNSFNERAVVLATVNPKTVVSGVSAVTTVVGGDYFQLQLYQDDSISITITGESVNTWFAMEIIE